MVDVNIFRLSALLQRRTIGNIMFSMTVYCWFWYNFTYFYVFLNPNIFGMNFQPLYTGYIDVEGPFSWLHLIKNAQLVYFFTMHHNLLSRPLTKSTVRRYVPKEIVRSLFVFTASCLMHFMVTQWEPNVVFYEMPKRYHMVIDSTFLFGLVLTLASTIEVDHFHLFGVIQPIHYRSFVKFQTRFLYRIIRHPIMTGFMICLWCMKVISLNRICFAFVMTIWIHATINHLEEPDLVRLHGQSYIKYCKVTSQFIPGF